MRGLHIYAVMALVLVWAVSTGCSEERVDGGRGSVDVGVIRVDGGDESCVPTVPRGPAELPTFTPCADGWFEVNDPVTCVTTCEPPPDWNPASPPEGVPTGNPAAAVNWSCPEGWHPTTVGDTAHCEPYGPDGPDTCGPYEAHFPGSPGCATIGTTCPQGDFPEGLPTDVPIVYVKPGPSGNGTRASPYGAIAEVPFETLTPGTVVALAKGTYEGSVAPRGTVTLWGACPAETVLTSESQATPGSWQGVVQVARSGVDLTVRNLRIANSRDVGVWLSGGSTPTRLRQVVIEQVTGTAVFMQRAGLDAQDVIVRDTRPFPGGVAGVGVDMRFGARAELRRALFERNRSIGLIASGEGAALTLEDAVVRDTQSQESNQAFGRGLNVQDGAQAEVRRALFERNRDTAVVVRGEDASGTLEDVVVRDTQSQEAGQTGGIGLGVQAHAEAVVRRALFEGNRDFGMRVEGAEAMLTLEDAVVRDTQSRRSDQGFGIGLDVATGARADVRRVLFERNRFIGVVAEEDTTLTLADVVIRDTQSRASDQQGGLGLSVEPGARAEVRRALFERNRDTALSVFGEGAVLTLEDAVVRDTLSQESDQTRGRGVSVQDQAQAEVRRALFERNRDVGLVVSGEASSLTLEDAVVRDTQSQESDQSGGRGVSVQDDAHAEVRRALLADNRTGGVLAEGESTELTLEDAVVRETQSRESDQLAGRGLEVQVGARAEVRRALFERNRETGIFVDGRDTALTMTDSVVRDTLSQELGQAFGRGLSVQVGAQADVRRALFEGNRELAVFVSDNGSTLTLEDAVVRDTQTRESDQVFGRGINVQTDAKADVRRVRVQNSRDFGIVALFAGAVSLMDVLIIGTRYPECFEAQGCPVNADALAAQAGEPVVGRRVTVDDSAQCGLRVMASDDLIPMNGRIELRDGRVSNNPIGVCIEGRDYPIETISGPTVEYLNNEQPIATTRLNVPRPAPAVQPTGSTGDGS